jgi:hypothetical protein
MRTLRSYGRVDDVLVVTVDIDTDLAKSSLEGADHHSRDEITLLAGDVLDPDLPCALPSSSPGGPRAS